MKKIDYKKEWKHLYLPSLKTISEVDVPDMNFVMIDGQGDPNKTSDFQEAIGVLFAVSYTLKFMIKKSDKAIDYGVMPLEGLWWTDDMNDFSMDNKDIWKWTLMIRQPDFIKEADVVQALDEVRKKKDQHALPAVRFQTYRERRAAQIMHIGPFSEEGPTIERLHKYILGNGYELAGKHHEIYLSDIRRAAPQKWKTIIRQPVK
jgi:hypothetical protein